MKATIEMQFEILKIGKTKNRETIRTTYKKLLIEHHPDKNPEKQEAAAKKTQEIVEAYEAIDNWLKNSSNTESLQTPISKTAPARSETSTSQKPQLTWIDFLNKAE